MIRKIFKLVHQDMEKKCVFSGKFLQNQGKLAALVIVTSTSYK